LSGESSREKTHKFMGLPRTLRKTKVQSAEGWSEKERVKANRFSAKSKFFPGVRGAN